VAQWYEPLGKFHDKMSPERTQLESFDIHTRANAMSSLDPTVQPDFRFRTDGLDHSAQNKIRINKQWRTGIMKYPGIKLEETHKHAACVFGWESPF
jgi:hypothetical protein